MEEGWSREAALACTAHPCELTVLGSRWSTNLTRPETSAEVPHQSWKKKNNNQDWALSLASLWWDVTGWRRGTRPPNQQHAELTVEWLCCFLIPRAFQSEMFWASKPVLTTLQIKRCQCCCHCFLCDGRLGHFWYELCLQTQLLHHYNINGRLLSVLSLSCGVFFNLFF